MPRLIWTPSALADIQRLHRFLVHKNPAAARRAVSAIRLGVRILSHQPHIGRPLDHAPIPGLREWLIDFGDNGYAVLYRANEAGMIVLLAIRHLKEAGY